MAPSISFVVPCYKLAHLLGECVSSILCQTRGDFEILIMDDCSPDNTAAVVSTFGDSRVRYIRNENNLGHLRNYNKGIGLSRGKYVWLISADDSLRSPYLLSRYVRIMDDNPTVGYVCCPGIRWEDGVETAIEGRLAARDTIFKGKALLFKLLRGNCITAASGMVRRSCYDDCGRFPLDLPYAGDWFLWCLFALHYDVGYCAEPMVNYRGHELSMTNFLMTHRRISTLREGFLVLWRLRQEAHRIGDNQVIEECDFRLARLYGMHLAGWDCGGWMYSMDEDDLEASLAEQTVAETEARRMRARIWTAAGDYSLKHNNQSAATEYYRRALQYDRRIMSLYARRLLARTGHLGVECAVRLKKLRKCCKSTFGGVV
jgi:glycosyltransferase involved in cell wall biosynthesis